VDRTDLVEEILSSLKTASTPVTAKEIFADLRLRGKAPDVTKSDINSALYGELSTRGLARVDETHRWSHTPMPRNDADLGSFFDRVKLLREEIRFEHELIFRRLAALLVSQPFLFATFALASQGKHPYMTFEWFPYVAVPAMGLISSIVVLVGIYEGLRRIHLLREFLYGKEGELAAVAERICPHLDRRGQAMSLLYAVALPMLFLVGWLTIAWVGVWLWVNGSAA
jgi:hypothetical protein